MLAIMNGVLVEIHKQPTPDLSAVEPASKFIIWEHLDYSSADALLTSYVDYADTANYWLMHHTEPTEFLYKASVWGVSNIINLLTNF